MKNLEWNVYAKLLETYGLDINLEEVERNLNKPREEIIQEEISPQPRTTIKTKNEQQVRENSYIIFIFHFYIDVGISGNIDVVITEPTRRC